MGGALSGHYTIEGLALTALREIRDERGAVLHMLRADAPEFAGFGELYFSEILPGARKAWKLHRTHTQNLAVPVGRIRVVIYDSRPHSPTAGAVAAIDLGRPDAYQRLRIPPSLWYGFKCLSDTPALIANCCDRVHDPAESESLPFDRLESPAAIRLLS